MNPNFRRPACAARGAAWRLDRTALPASSAARQPSGRAHSGAQQRMSPFCLIGRVSATGEGNGSRDRACGRKATSRTRPARDRMNVEAIERVRGLTATKETAPSTSTRIPTRTSSSTPSLSGCKPARFKGIVPPENIETARGPGAPSNPSRLISETTGSSPFRSACRRLRFRRASGPCAFGARNPCSETCVSPLEPSRRSES